MIRINLIILAFVACNISAADFGVDIGSTMCGENEDVYISCTFSRVGRKSTEKVASICARNNLSPSEGYVQYRFGVPGTSPEFVYPQRRIPPKNVFKLHTGVRDDSESARSLRFSSGGYLYSFERKGLEGYWLVVKSARKTVFRKYCEEPGKPYISDRAKQGVGE